MYVSSLGLAARTSRREGPRGRPGPPQSVAATSAQPQHPSHLRSEALTEADGRGARTRRFPPQADEANWGGRRVRVIVWSAGHVWQLGDLLVPQAWCLQRQKQPLAASVARDPQAKAARPRAAGAGPPEPAPQRRSARASIPIRLSGSAATSALSSSMIERAVPLRSSMTSRTAVVQSHGNATAHGGRRDRGRSRDR